MFNSLYLYTNQRLYAHFVVAGHIYSLYNFKLVVTSICILLDAPSKIVRKPYTVADDGGYAKNSNPQCGNTGERILSNEPRKH